MQMFNAEQLQEKWAPILDHEGSDKIQDSHRRMVTAVLLENQEKALNEEREFLSESPTNNTGSNGGTAGFDPVLISLIRRAMPNLVAYDLAGVQPMNGPTGLIFAMRSRYDTQSGSEALFDEADTSFSAQDTNDNLTSAGYTKNEGSDTGGAVGFGTTASTSGGTPLDDPGLLNPESSAKQKAYTTGRGMDTEDAESLGGTGGNFNQMAFSIEKVTVTVVSYTHLKMPTTPYV